VHRRTGSRRRELPPVFSCTSCAKGCARVRLAMQGIGDEPKRHRLGVGGHHHDLLNARSGPCWIALERPARSECAGADLVCPGRLRPAAGAAPRRCVTRCSRSSKRSRYPAIVNRPRTMRRGCSLRGEHTEEAAAENTIWNRFPRFLWRQIRKWDGCFPIRKLDLRDEIHDQITVRADSLRQGPNASGPSPLDS